MRMTESTAKQEFAPRRRTLFWLTLSLAATALLLAPLLLLQREPSYQNRSLSSWLEDLPWPVFAFNIPNGFNLSIVCPVYTTKERDAQEAIRAIGTNAL